MPSSLRRSAESPLRRMPHRSERLPLPPAVCHARHFGVRGQVRAWVRRDMSRRGKRRRAAALQIPFYFLAGGQLSGLQKRLDEFALAADGQAGKFLEPFAVRHFGVGVQPLREQNNLAIGDFALSHSRQKMPQQSFRQLLAANFRHEVRCRKIRAQFLPATDGLPPGLLPRPFVWRVCPILRPKAGVNAPVHLQTG